MITARILSSAGIEEVGLDTAMQAGDDTVVWIDVVGRQMEEIRKLADHYGFHELAVEDVVNAHQRPKIEDYGNHLFMVFYGLGGTPEEEDDEEFDVFLMPGVMVTVRDGSTTDMGPVLRRLQTDPPEGARAGYVLWAVLDEVVDNYFKVVDALDENIDKLEEMVFEIPRPESLHEHIFDARKGLIRLRRRVTPMRDILNTLISRPGISRAVLPYLQDVYDHVLRITDTVDTFRELVSSAHDSYLTEVSNDMNRVMKRFTSIGAILVSGALVTGIYGMNFHNMPELNWKLGYPFALGSMVALMAVLYWYFKRRDWL